MGKYQESHTSYYIALKGLSLLLEKQVRKYIISRSN